MQSFLCSFRLITKARKKMKVESRKKGFTIIEVVLVLAIAGLIFLMVFIALPAMQRGQRDTQRRNDLARVITAVQNYQTNNKGKIPDFKKNFITNYLKTAGDTFTDPSGTEYKFYTSAAAETEGIGDCAATSGKNCSVQAPTTFTSGVIVAVKKATCDGEKAVQSSGENKFAILMKLEGAGVSCYSN